MRSLKVLTLTAAVAAFTVTAALAQTVAPPAAPAAAVSADPLQAALADYAGLQSDVTEMRRARIGSAAELETALDRGGRHNRDALTHGWIAYGAYTAMQSPAFAAGVRATAARYGRDQVMRAIAYDPNYARTLPGNGEAVALTLGAANADSARIISVADRYQELAYGLQRSAWANAVAPQQNARLQRVRSLGVAGAAPAPIPAAWSPRLAVTPLSVTPASDATAFGGRRFWDAVSGGADVVQTSAPAPTQLRIDGPRGEAVGRMLSVAALQALDAAHDNASMIGQLLADRRSRDCFEMAQLQLYQCMSAAHYRYENAFCLGQHALRDVGLCIGAVAHPDTTAMTPLPAAVAPGARPQGLE